MLEMWQKDLNEKKQKTKNQTTTHKKTGNWKIWSQSYKIFYKISNTPPLCKIHKKISATTCESSKISALVL